MTKGNIVELCQDLHQHDNRDCLLARRGRVGTVLMAGAERSMIQFGNLVAYVHHDLLIDHGDGNAPAQVG